jgi:hypothetical protein
MFDLTDGQVHQEVVQADDKNHSIKGTIQKIFV